MNLGDALLHSVHTRACATKPPQRTFAKGDLLRGVHATASSSCCGHAALHSAIASLVADGLVSDEADRISIRPEGRRRGEALAAAWRTVENTHGRSGAGPRPPAAGAVHSGIVTSTHAAWQETTAALSRNHGCCCASAPTRCA